MVFALLLTVGLGAFLLEQPGAESRTLLGAVVGLSLWLVRPVFTGELALRSASKADAATLQAAAVPPAGQALLYVYRSGYLSAMVDFHVEVDGHSVCTLKSPRFTRLALTPGEHVLRCGPRGTAGRGNRSEDSVVQVAAGEVVVLAVRAIATGWNSAKTVLVRDADPAAAMLRLASMKGVPAAEIPHPA